METSDKWKQANQSIIVSVCIVSPSFFKVCVFISRISNPAFSCCCCNCLASHFHLPPFRLKLYHCHVFGDFSILGFSLLDSADSNRVFIVQLLQKYTSNQTQSTRSSSAWRILSCAHSNRCAGTAPGKRQRFDSGYSTSVGQNQESAIVRKNDTRRVRIGALQARRRLAAARAVAKTKTPLMQIRRRIAATRPSCATHRHGRMSPCALSRHA